MPASLDPTTVVSTSTFPTTTTTTNAHPIRTTSPHDPQTQTPTQAPSPSTLFAELSLFSPSYPVLYRRLQYYHIHHHRHQHLVDSPSRIRIRIWYRDIILLRCRLCHSRFCFCIRVLEEEERLRRFGEIIWRMGSRSPSPRSRLRLRLLLNGNVHRATQEHTGSFDEQAPQRPATEEEITKNASDTSPPTDPRPPHRSSSPSERAGTPPPTPKVKPV